jgi:hypothetical protein
LKFTNSHIALLLKSVLVAAFTSGEAQAYIDPNSAGLLYQIFFPVILAVTLAWRWIKEMFKQLWVKVTRKAEE